MSYPEYAKVNNKLYKINTDFKVALKCEEIANSDVSDEERALAIIYLLFGDEGLDNPKDYEILLEKAQKYLSCGKELEKNTDVPDMDFEQDKSFIKASFYTDYGIKDIYNTEMHFWEFMDLMNGLKPDCVLNRVREIRNYDTSGIKDAKTLSQLNKQKQAVALKRKEVTLTDEEQQNVDNFLKAINYKK